MKFLGFFWKIERLLLLLFVMAEMPSNCWSDPLDVWHWRNPLPTGNHLHGIARGNGKFVAVGWNYGPGAILTSSDGIAWSPQTAPTFTSLRGIVYGAGLFVAVGDPGVILSSPDGVFVMVGAFYGAIATSQDAVGWTRQSSPRRAGLYGITYADGTFVTVGETGNIITSNDGVSWASRSNGNSAGLDDIAYGNGTYVAVGSTSYYTSLILRSTNGLDWLTLPPLGHAFYSISHGNDTFVAVGGYESGYIASSHDGLDWIDFRLPSGPYTGVTFGNGLFVTVGDAWPFHNGIIATSSDGTNWQEDLFGSSNSLSSVTYGNDTFVAVGGSGTILTSKEVITWELQNSGTASYLFSVAYGNGLFVVIGGQFGTPPTLLTSVDGMAWTSHPPLPANSISRISYGGGVFVAVGGDRISPGIILTSEDGIHWNIKNSPTSRPLSGVTYANGTFIAVGDAGTIIQSDAVSVPRITTSKFSGNGFELTMTGEIGKQYRLQFTGNLPVAGWKDLFTFSLSGRAAIFSDTAASRVTQRFYRLVSP